jgi:hypothetical protein
MEIEFLFLNWEHWHKYIKSTYSIVFLIYVDGRVEVSEELKDLYSIYQQEIHASVYTSLPRTQSRMVYDTKLPPIYNRT